MDQSIVNAIHQLAKNRNQSFIEPALYQTKDLMRGRDALDRRQVRRVHSKAAGDIVRVQRITNQTVVDYVIQYEWLIKQKDQLYVEERQERRRAQLRAGEVEKDEEIMLDEQELDPTSPLLPNVVERLDELRHKSRYNRLEAVRYAERWWNDYNPEYNRFTDNCTNFISQCLYAGGSPMNRTGQKSKGWWTDGASWSLSWSVAHSLRWYLSGSSQGLKGEEKETASELEPGDVICYDFTGDGRWQHTTIVVAKDENNEPLVNAQTVNSRMRYWTYEDSTAWTPEINYKFFKIVVI
ncbi:amidase domain-containing protein [Alkalihalobacillus sp. NPDC078783]